MSSPKAFKIKLLCLVEVKILFHFCIKFIFLFESSLYLVYFSKLTLEKINTNFYSQSFTFSISNISKVIWAGKPAWTSNSWRQMFPSGLLRLKKSLQGYFFSEKTKIREKQPWKDKITDEIKYLFFKSNGTFQDSTMTKNSRTCGTFLITRYS